MVPAGSIAMRVMLRARNAINGPGPPILDPAVGSLCLSDPLGVGLGEPTQIGGELAMEALVVEYPGQHLLGAALGEYSAVAPHDHPITRSPSLRAISRLRRVISMLPVPQLPTHGEPPGQLRVGGRSECARLLVMDVNPFDAVGSTDRVHDWIKAAAHESVDSLDTGMPKGVDQLHGHC
jgi:hypothetical protein